MVRPKFKETQAVQPKKKKNHKSSKADMALAYINKLYQIEWEIKAVSIEQRLQTRQNRTLPILKLLR